MQNWGGRCLRSQFDLELSLNNRKIYTAWRLNLGILNRDEYVKKIKEDIKTYIEDNDTGDVSPIILWDALKAILWGK